MEKWNIDILKLLFGFHIYSFFFSFWIFAYCKNIINHLTNSSSYFFFFLFPPKWLVQFSFWPSIFLLQPNTWFFRCVCVKRKLAQFYLKQNLWRMMSSKPRSNEHEGGKKLTVESNRTVVVFLFTTSGASQCFFFRRCCFRFSRVGSHEYPTNWAILLILRMIHPLKTHCFFFSHSEIYQNFV